CCPGRAYSNKWRDAKHSKRLARAPWRRRLDGCYERDGFQLPHLRELGLLLWWRRLGGREHWRRPAGVGSLGVIRKLRVLERWRSIRGYNGQLHHNQQHLRPCGWWRVSFHSNELFSRQQQL